jgi:F-type H+-transporting ATPase subunit b
MELNLTTFLLEIANFLVLLWILQRFLYKPVLDVIAKRKAGIDQALADAARVRDEAAALQEQYNARLSDWEQQKRRAQENLQRDIDAQRAKLLAELYASLDEERSKAKIIEERRKADEQVKNQSLALANGALFAAKLLQRAAGPELEKRLFDLLLEHLADLPEATAEALRSNHQQQLVGVTVYSAYPLAEAQRAELQQNLGALLGKTLSYEFHQNPELLAGLRIVIGAWVLGANLQDELAGFARFAP